MAKLENLKELAKVVNRNKIKNIYVIGNDYKTPTIFDRFYNALLEDRFETDEEYSYFFYKKKHLHKAYYKLRERLEERLMNTLFFIDVNKPNFIPLQKAYYECYKDAYAIKILIARNAKKLAIDQAEKVLKKSIYYSFTDINVELTRILLIHYGGITRNKKKYAHYHKILKHQLKILKHEVRAEQYYSELFVNHENLNSFNREMIPKAIKCSNKLKKIKQKFSSYRLIFYSNAVHILRFEIQNDWQNVLNTCNQALEYLKNNPRFSSPSMLDTYLYRKIMCFLILKEFQQGEKIANKYFKNPVTNPLNWLMICELLFRIQLHSKQFEKAKKTFLVVTKNQSINTQYQLYTEYWKIHEAFINYLTRIGKISEGQGENKLKPFRLSKFLNEVPGYSKDKRGSNITILILQILFLLEEQKYDVIIDRTEALKTYTHRYLKDDDTFRSSCFIKMLLCLPAASFKKEQVIKKAKKYLDKLRSVPIEKAKQSAEIEVMPYEMLWEFVLESLN